MILFPPVHPWRGFRDTDSYGSGVFGASRDGGTRKHLGRDLITVPGDIIFPGFPCQVKRLGFPYPDHQLQLIELHGTGLFEGWQSIIMYLQPTAQVGRHVEADEQIGVADDLTAYYRRIRPQHTGDITNHVHWEMRVPVDAGDMLPPDLQVHPDLRA